MNEVGGRGASDASDASMDGPLTVVVAAMKEEVAALLLRIEGARQVAIPGVGGGLDVTMGRLRSAAIAVAVTGDGERNARRGLTALLATLPSVRRVIVAGVAGGLHPMLAQAALVVCERVVEETASASHAASGAASDAASDAASGTHLVRRADAGLVEAAAKNAGARRGVAVTTARIADTVAEKRRLLGVATAGDGAPSPPAVVDLESAAFAAVADKAGVPWVVLRAVSDTADEALPPLLNRSRDDGGAVQRGRVVARLLGNPGALFPLLVLRQRVRACAETLSRAVVITISGMAVVEGGASLAVPVAPSTQPTGDV
jgi:adenosylhomocysteine nucleosidase